MKLMEIFVKTMKIMGKRCALYLLSIVFMSTGGAMFSVISSLLMKSVIDAAQPGSSVQLFPIIVVNVVGGILALVTFRAGAIAYNVEAKRAYGKICQLLFAHEVRLPYSYYEEHHSGEFMSKLSYDLEKMGSIYGSRFRRTVAPLLHVIVFVIPMLILSWQVTLCLIGVNLLILLTNALFIQPMRRVAKTLSNTNSQMTEKFSNLLQGMEQARMYIAGRNTVEEFQRENVAYAKQSRKKILYTACLESSGKGFDLMCALIFLMLGIYFVQSGHTSLGALAAIYTLYGGFSFQFLQLGRYLPELIGCMTNAQNIFEFLEEEREPHNWYREENNHILTSNQEFPAEDYICILGVDFSYREDKPLLQSISLSVQKGECVAVTGSSGCGKSTLSKLLLGLYPIHGGSIKVAGYSYGDLTNEQIRELIAYVPQEPYLFNESIRDNIRIGKQDATEEELVWAAQMANAHDFIINLESGYDTFVGERGNKLSGGQRQRIAIARAILKGSPIVLLDEATSALDNESEKLVNDALKSMKHGKTIIMIAHRPSTIALADKVWDLSNA